MAIIKFPKKEIEKHFKINQKILDEISMFGTPAQILADELEIEINPNRPDLIPMQGFIRAFKAFKGKSNGLTKYKINKPEKNYKVKVESSVKEVRPYTVCAIIKNLKFDNEKIKELVNIQEKIHSTLGRNRKKVAIGIYPLEKIKLPIKYEARKPLDIKFIPLDTTKEMNAIQILKRHPAGKEYAYLLKTYQKFPVFVDANKKILSMPPIINSQEIGKVTEKTKEVFIECSGFDKNALNKTLNILVTTFADMGGKIYSMIIEDKKKEITPNLEPEKMKISLENVNKLLGLKLKEENIEKLLKKMGYNYKNKTVFIPAWRTDILHEVDIIEDIAIAYGYDKFAPEIPELSTIGEESKEDKLKERISEILIGLKLLEISSYHLIKSDEAKKMKVDKPIEIENSKTEYKILRPNLLIPTLRTLSENKDNEYPQHIFEIGRVFSLDEKKETRIKEQENLIIALTPGNFTEAKQTLDYLLKILALNYKLEETTHPNLIDGRTGKILLNNKEIGYIGEVHPNTLRNWNLKMPLALIEINLDEVMKEIH
ncbi:MAG: phenylalanine--tRNA ligase subunit beta [Nanoarchaeota archaeon]|nr:phenylalanine--tRNA ligase subunit beta [Nanoarchaeota archaeon]